MYVTSTTILGQVHTDREMMMMMMMMMIIIIIIM